MIRKESNKVLQVKCFIISSALEVSVKKINKFLAEKGDDIKRVEYMPSDHSTSMCICVVVEYWADTDSLPKD